MKKTLNRLLGVAALSLLVLLPAIGMSQSTLMYNSSRNPLMNGQNPAFFPSHSRIYLSLPNFNIGFGSPVSVNSLLQYDSVQDKTIININRALDTLSSDKFRFGLNVHPVGLGLNFNRLYITLATQLKVQFGVGVPQGVVTFLNEGNYGYRGLDENGLPKYIELINGDFINATLYAEAAIGAGYRVTDNLTVGVRFKGLMGIADLSNAGSSLKLITEEDCSAITADLDINMNLTLPYMDTLSTTIESDEILNSIQKNPIPQNFGFNLDLGARFNTDLFEVSASIIDFGPGIHWTKGIHKIVSAHETNRLTFSGIDVTETIHGGQIDTGYARLLIDTLRSMIDYKVINEGVDYWTSIPTKINLGGLFHLTDGISAGLLFHGEFERGIVKVEELYKSKITGFRSSTSLVARLNLGDWIEFIASTSVIQNKKNWDWFNPGAGFTLSLFRSLQTYVFIDYISAFPLTDAKQFNLSFGLNLLIGRSNDN